MNISSGELIEVPYPDEDDLRLRISAAPARLRIRPVDSNTWVTGTFTDPGGSRQATINLSGTNLKIESERKLGDIRSGLPEFDLQLGTHRPFSLEIRSAASDKNTCELGGLQLTRFTCEQAAGEIDITWSTPNETTMEGCTIRSGASRVRLHRLANANARRIEIQSGAADMKLDFLGTLAQNTRAKVQTGVAEVEIGVDPTEPVVITTSTRLGETTIPDGFVTDQGVFKSRSAFEGQEPVLSLELSTTLGLIRVVDATSK